MGNSGGTRRSLRMVRLAEWRERESGSLACRCGMGFRPYRVSAFFKWGSGVVRDLEPNSIRPAALFIQLLVIIRRAGSKRGCPQTLFARERDVNIFIVPEFLIFAKKGKIYA